MFEMMPLRLCWFYIFVQFLLLWGTDPSCCDCRADPRPLSQSSWALFSKYCTAFFTGLHQNAQKRTFGFKICFTYKEETSQKCQWE